jgi:hypothetical protein
VVTLSGSPATDGVQRDCSATSGTNCYFGAGGVPAKPGDDPSNTEVSVLLDQGVVVSAYPQLVVSGGRALPLRLFTPRRSTIRSKSAASVTKLAIALLWGLPMNSSRMAGESDFSCRCGGEPGGTYNSGSRLRKSRWN